MKRPVFYILLFLAIGIIAGRYAKELWHIALFGFSVCFAGYCAFKLTKNVPTFVLPFAAMVGYILCVYAGIPHHTEVDRLTDKQISVSGRVHSVLYRSNSGNSCFLLTAEAFDDKENSVISSDARIRVYSEERVYPGDRIIVEGKLQGDNEKSNPADFDRKAYMLARKQDYTVYADKVIYKGSELSLNAVMQGIKEKACEVFYKAMPEKDAELMCGMMLGETVNIDSDIDELYKKTGIYHAIAISGLHITLVGGILLKLLTSFNKTIGMIATIAILSCYCILTGCSVSVVRAVIMFYIMLLGSVLLYDYDIISSGALSACILLVYSPYYLFDAGFQLSFGAVFAIGAVRDITERFKGNNKIIEAAGFNLGVDLAVKPISAFHFYYVNIWSVIANLIIIPFMSAAVALGFVIALAGFISDGAAKLLAMPVVLILNAVEGWCRFFEHIPLSYVITGRLPWLFILLYFVFLFVVYKGIMLNKLKGALVTVAVFICLCIGARVCSSLKNTTEVTFLKVGQGDCAVAAGKGYCIVVDSGNEGNGENVLLPHLMYKGVSKVDKVFISHTDSDHIKGITEIIGEINIEDIYLPSVYNENENYKELESLCNTYNINLDIFNQGEVIRLNKTDKIECLYPYDNLSLEENNTSMVNRLVSGKGSVLFTGDIEAEAEQLLLKSNTDLKADVLKLAHHGSPYSNTKEFISEVKPLLAVASAQKSVYGHPADKVINFLEKNKITCYITEYSGAVTVKFSQKGIYVNTQREDNYE